MKRIGVVVFATIAFTVATSGISAQTAMDPSEYLETAKATADIARVIDGFNRYAELNDPLFLMHGDVVIPKDKGLVDSYAGKLTGDFQGFDAFVYARVFRNETVSARVFGMWSNFGFRLDDASLAASPFGFTDDASTGWITGYALFGAQARVERNRYTLGAVLRFEPVVTDGPPELFGYEYDPDGNFRTSVPRFERLYADADIDGWKVDTLLSLEALERLAVLKLFDLAMAGLELGPAARYLGRLGSFRPGFGTRWSPAAWFEAEASAFAAVGTKGVGFGEAALDLGFPIRIGKNEKHEGKDFTVRLDARGSLLGAESGVLPGGRLELSVDNARGLTIWDWLGWADVYLGASAGVAWNHADTLARMPFEDRLLFYFKLHAALY